MRIDGAFPAFSPDYSQVAFVNMGFDSIDVMNMDGSNRRSIFEGETADAVRCQLVARSATNRIQSRSRVRCVPKSR